MRNFSEISIIVLIACFCFIKSAAYDQITETRNYALLDFHSITIDGEDDFLLNGSQGILLGSLNNLFINSTIFNPVTTSHIKIQGKDNLRSRKLNLLTIDIPPPHWYIYL